MSVYATADYKPETRRILSVDGEGITDNKRHAYVLLAAADDTGFRSYVAHDGSHREQVLHDGPRYSKTSAYHPDDMASNYGLPTIKCLEFLLSLPRAKSDLITSFAFTYDSTKILQDLPYAALREYAELGVTSWNGYTISGIPRKYLEITHGERHVKVWDVFTYWQMSFVKALKSSPELFNAERSEIIAMIASMKLERGHLEEISDDEIREYCFSECEFLSTLYRDLLRWTDHLGLKATGAVAHGGPGALASSFYDRIKLSQFLPAGNPATYLAGLPVNVAIHSYYGGRFETARLGAVGDLIEFDIQSAYPSVTVNLPCLRCGQFREVTEYEPGKPGFYFVGSRTSGPWAPFPFRADAETGRAWLNGASKGSIAFVHGGRRWVTGSEVDIARKHFGAEAIPVYSGWVFDVGCDHKPFAEVLRMYLQRKIGNPACHDCQTSPKHFCPRHPAPSPGLSKIIKLIINSVYGKLAQSIGRPKYQSYIWAAWITGGTRAQVMDAALELGTDCVSIATDGILVTRDLPARFRVTDWELGTWERELKPDAWLGMPGIYSFRDRGKPDECGQCRVSGYACRAHTNDKKFKRRGLDARYFPAEHLRSAWERGQWKVYPLGNPDECAECRERGSACVNHPPIAFMPLKLAVMRKDALNVIGEWVPTPKTVSFGSIVHKRNMPESVMDYDPLFILPHDGSTIDLEVITIPDNIRSATYSPKQAWDKELTPAETFQLWDEMHLGHADDPDMPMWADWEDKPESMEMEMM